MKKAIRIFTIFILVITATPIAATISYEMTTAQINKLIAATIYFNPVPKINTGTDENPVWEDSCSAAAWTKKHYENVMRKTWDRYDELTKKKAIVREDF